MVLIGDANPVKIPRPKGTSGTFLMSILLFYAIGRFLYHPTIYPSIIIFFLAYIWSFFKTRSYNSVAVWVMGLCVALAILPGVWCYFYGDIDTGNYYIFVAFILLCLSSPPGFFEPKKSKGLRLLVAGYIAICTPFLLFPEMETMGTRVLSAQEIISAIYNPSNIGRARAFFYHTNEFALYTTALFIMLLFSGKISKSSWGEKVVGTGLLIMLLVLLAASKSSTAFFMVAVAISFYITRGKLVSLAMIIGFIIMTFLQIFAAKNVASHLESGSFFWRFLIADKVTEMTPALLDFTPFRMGETELGSWPHSLILDYIFVYGKIGGFVLLVTLVIFFLGKELRYRVGWISMFFLLASVQPIGAMPVAYIALAIATVYAERCKQLENRGA